MVKTLLSLLLFLCGLALPAQALPQGASPESTAAQDGTGTVWMLPQANNAVGELNCWRGTWAARKVPEADGFRPLVLTSGGSFVYVLWQKQDQGQAAPPQCLVTVQRGVGSRILARFSGQVLRNSGFPNQPAIYAGTDGAVWVAGFQPLLWHITPDGSVQTFPLKPEQNFSNSFPSTLGFPSPRWHSLAEGAGRRWFWQDQPQGFPQGGLHGVLIWNGKALNYYATLPGVPDQPFSVIAPLDAGHVWLAIDSKYTHWPRTPQAALYRVDTRTLTAVPEAISALGAFQSITQVFQANGDGYAAIGQNGSSVLWRRHTGVWRKFIDALEAPGGYYRPDDQHPWLAETGGVWLGISGGAWWLPRGGQPPFLVNWRRGLFTQRVSGLFPLPNGRIFAASETGGMEMPPTPQPVRPLPPGIVTGGLGAPPSLGPLMSDTRRHLWGTPVAYSGPCPLYEWDGTRWRTHLPPKDSRSIRGLYACDTRGRLWLNSYEWHPPAQSQPVEGYMVYDPAHDTWTSYTTQPDALAAAAALPGMAFLPRHDLYQPPLFSGDGRVADVSGSIEVSLYDGKIWRRWQSGDIIQGYGGNSPSQMHFNAQGNLELTLDVQICEWTPGAGWQKIGTRNFVPYVDPVPPGGPHGLFWGNPAVDDLGVKWFAGNDAVYAAGYGLWAKEDGLSASGSPFRAGFEIEDALHDPDGRLFFVSRPAGYYDFVVWSPPPVPAPTLFVVPISDDSVTVRFGTKLTGTHWFLWRLNGGVWSAPTPENTLTLTALARGNYRLEAQMLDRHLLTSAPAADVFAIQVAPETQIARWVRALLSGTDDEREAAVAGLVKQPEAARAALKAARPSASESGRWWIDAALQQVEEAY